MRCASPLQKGVKAITLLFDAPPGALIKYQIATYLFCNPQNASSAVEESSWECASWGANQVPDSNIFVLQSARRLI